MTIKECYKELGGNFDEALNRFRSEAIIKKFALKFLNDKSFSELTNQLSENNTEEAFRAAHTLKGVCQNLSFSKLAESGSEITELLRAEKLEDAKSCLSTVTDDYNKTVTALKELADEQ